MTTADRILEEPAPRADLPSRQRPQVVVVCGGRGTRLAPSIGDLPKVLTPLAGRPLLGHLLADLGKDLGRLGGDVLLLAGYGGERVAEAARQLAPPSLQVETLIEDRPLGTSGALHALAGRLRERFVFVCGDILTSLDWRRFWDFSIERGGLGTLLVHRSSHPEDSDLVVLDDRDRAVGWSRRGDRRVAGGGALGNAGVAVLHRDVLRYVPRDRPSDLFRDVVPPLVDRRAPIHGYRTPEYVRDMGTPDRLISVNEDLVAGRVRLKAELVMLDRDGVINEELNHLLTRAEQMRLIPGSGEAIRRFNEAGVKVAVVTNQSVIARGLCSVDELERIHGRMRELLAAEGAHLDRIDYSPHHPETHYGEGVAELRGPSRCRKPSTAMAERALEAFDVPAWRSAVIGDRTSDMQLAMNMGLAGIAVETGCALGDKVCPAEPVWTFPDLAAAARWLVPAEP